MKKFLFLLVVLAVAVGASAQNTDSALNTGTAASESCQLKTSSCTNPFITKSGAPGTTLWREFANPWGVTSATTGTSTVNYNGSGTMLFTINYTGVSPASGVDGFPLLRYGGDIFNTAPILGQGLTFPVQVSAMSSLVVDTTYTLTNTTAPANQDVGWDQWVIPTSNYSGGISGAFEIAIMPYFNFSGACSGGGATFVGNFSYNVNGSPTSWSLYSWGSGAGNEQIFCPTGTQFTTGEITFDMLPMIQQAIASAGGATVTNSWYLSNMDLGTEWGGSATVNYTVSVTKVLYTQTLAGGTVASSTSGAAKFSGGAILK
jgi:hypothetical protein